jgi:hypothetical protein
MITVGWSEWRSLAERRVTWRASLVALALRSRPEEDPEYEKAQIWTATSKWRQLIRDVGVER